MLFRSEKLESILDFYRHDLTKFERWMLRRALRKVRGVVRRDALLRKAMEVVINAPPEVGRRYDVDTQRFFQVDPKSIRPLDTKPTWTDPRGIFGLTK